LRLAAGPAVARELARALGVHHEHVARCLGRLAKCGLARVVAREGRRHIYALTPEGTELAAVLLAALSALRRQEA
jgi:DNA-binding IclR family transcriptional regulator